MDLVIIVGMVSFFGLAVLSAVAQRSAPPPAPIIIVRAEPLLERDGEHGAGIGLLLLLAVVIGAALFL